MRKVVGIVGGVIAVGALTWGGLFYWRNLRGIGPAVRAPKEDIAELISNPSQPPLNLRGGESGEGLNLRAGEIVLGEGENTTGMPLKLPPGFSIEIFAKDLPGARVMAMDLHGGMYVTRTRENKVTYLQAEDGKVVRQFDVFGEMRRPHGIVQDPQNPFIFYIAQEDKIVRIRTESGAPIEKIVNLPAGGNHFTRTIMFMPGADPPALLVSVGSSCNVCEEVDGWRAGLTLVTLDGRVEPYAKGLRNAVFMATNPVTGQQWVTEMGRDLLGDDLPPDEINIVHYQRHYGWPWCFGKQVHDGQYDPRGTHKDFCETTKPSYIDLPAHVAPLGLVFVPEEGWPEEYWYDLLVAFHGSWNRSEPVGYKIARLRLDAHGNFENTDAQGNPVIEDFITGWLQDDGGALGRPVDILIQPGGVMYISDDKAGVIYKVIYTGK